MERYIWTADQDEVIRGMILEGKTVADICDRLGCTDTQLKNHVEVVRRRDPSFPTLCGEVKGERFVLASSEDAAVMSGEPGQIVVGSPDEGTVEPIVEPSKTEEKKADLNPLEKQMADIIAEQKETIDNLRVELETEQEARKLEAEAYRNEVKRLTDQISALRGTVSAQGDELAAKDKLVKKLYADLDEACRERDEETRSDLLRDAQDQLHDVMDEVMALNAEVHKKDELIVAMAKAIFLGEKEVILA
jgi:metal-responsive CopG/Arc/MetJ family transcriptional regulator